MKYVQQDLQLSNAQVIKSNLLSYCISWIMLLMTFSNKKCVLKMLVFNIFF